MSLERTRPTDRCSKKMPWMALAALVSALVLAGCDDSATPISPEGIDDTANGEDPVSELSEAAALFKELSLTLDEAAALLFAGGGQIEGAQGVVVVNGSTLIFDSYSPNNEVVIDGQLQIGLAVQPMSVTGQLHLISEQRRTAELNVTVDLATSPPTYGGTLTMDGEVYEVAAIVAEAAAQDDD